MKSKAGCQKEIIFWEIVIFDVNRFVNNKNNIKIRGLDFVFKNDIPFYKILILDK